MSSPAWAGSPAPGRHLSDIPDEQVGAAESHYRSAGRQGDPSRRPPGCDPFPKRRATKNVQMSRLDPPQDPHPLEALVARLQATGAPDAARLPHLLGVAAAAREPVVQYGECARLLFPLLTVRRADGPRASACCSAQLARAGRTQTGRGRPCAPCPSLTRQPAPRMLRPG